MRTPAQLRRYLAAILAERPRILARWPDMPPAERRELELAWRRARLRLHWLDMPARPEVVLALERNARRRRDVWLESRPMWWMAGMDRARRFTEEYLQVVPPRSGTLRPGGRP